MLLNFSFLLLFVLIGLVFRWTKPEVSPFKRWKFWIVFIASAFILWCLFIVLVLIALGGGKKQVERETERDTILYNK